MADQFPTRQVQPVLVQTVPVGGGLPDDDTGWVVQYWLRFESGSEGAGQIVGDAVLQQRFGIVTQQNQPNQVVTGTAPSISGGIDSSLLGCLVRLIVADDDGDIDITDSDGTNSYTAFWWGQINAFSVEPDGRDSGNAGGTATWRAVGIVSKLDDITINNGFILTIEGESTPWMDPGYFPPFNDLPGGDMSVGPVNVGNGNASVHDLSTLDEGNLWTADEAINLLLVGCASPDPFGEPLGWTWAYADPDGVLAFNMEKTDINGMTIFQAIVTIANARRGITFYTTVDGSTVTLTFYSGNANDITVGSFVFPGSTKTASYTAAGNVWTYGMSISMDSSSQFDIIECHGSQPWVGLTLDYSVSDVTALDDGWDSDQESNWDSDNQYPLTDQVWRRFVLTTSWLGNQYGSTSTGIRNGLATDAGQYTGARVYTENNAPPPTVYAMERMLPVGVTFDSITDGYRLTPNQPPVVIIGPDDDGNYQDFSQQCSVECQSFPPGLVINLDNQFGANMANLMQEGQSLLVTLGFREPQPLRVSWVAPQNQWPSPMPRIKMIHIPDIEQWLMLDGSVTGLIEGEGGYASVSGDQYARDDTDQLRQILALSVARYGYPQVTASWGEAAILDTSSALAPGTLLTDIVTGTDDVTVNAVITRRSWKRVVRDGVDMYDTTWETTRVMASFEAVI